MKTCKRSIRPKVRWSPRAVVLTIIVIVLAGTSRTRAAIPLLRMPFPASSEFKWKVDYGSPAHVGKDTYALDLNLRTGGDTDWGQPVLASAVGTVRLPEPDVDDGFGYGYWVKIRHSDDCWTIYAHLDKVTVRDGQSIRQGQVIGLVGKTGLSSAYYTHLHWAVWKDEFGVKTTELPVLEEGFSWGDTLVESINVMKRPVGVMAGQYSSAIASSVINKFFDYRDELGWPVDDGGGILLHEWGFNPAQRWSWKWHGNYIQNFDGGDWGSCALVYNPAKGKAYTLHGGFWNVFRYGVGDGSGWGPTIAIAGKQLGFPESDEYSDGSEVRQNFGNGMMVWDGTDVHIYTKAGQRFLTTHDNGPIFALGTEPISSSRVRLSFPSVANAASYQVWIDGILAGAVSAQSAAQKATLQTAGAEESITLADMSPGMSIGVQVRAVDDQGNDLSRSPMAVAQSLQDFISIEPVSSNLLVKADQPFALAVDAAGPSVLSFAWYSNGELRATNDIPEFYIDEAGWSEAGTWTVVAEDQGGGSAATEIRVQVGNLDYGHWQKTQIENGESLLDPTARNGTSASETAEADLRAYSFGKTAAPAIVIADAGPTGTVLQLKRLYEPRDLVYTVRTTQDLLNGWTGTVARTTLNYVGPSEEPPYGIWDLSTAITAAPACFFTAGASSVGQRELVFFDDFEDNVLNPSLWNWQRNRVDETNGTLNVVTAETDNGGQAWSASVPIGQDTIEVVRRAKVRYGNEYSLPKLSLRYIDSDGKDQRVCAVFYGNMNGSILDDYPEYPPVTGTILGLGNANPHSSTSNADTIQGPPVLWDTWFLEKLSFDNATGLVRYSVNGTEVINGYAPTIDPSSEVSAYIDAWGWWTGHANLSEYLEVYRRHSD